VLVGFSTFDGTVTAADNWDSPAQTKRVLPARPDSHESLLHATGMERFMLPLRNLPEALAGLDEPRLERAIGVIYRPQTERQSHYFEGRLPRRFDAIIHIGTTSAIRPLEWAEGDDAFADGEAPETFPSGM
jgi:erythromycin esterase-like protein